MTSPQERQWQEMWRGRPLVTPGFTPELLAARAAQFDEQVRRRQRRDLASFALTMLIVAVGVIMIPGLWVKVGGTLLVVWCLYSIWALRRFGRVTEAASSGDEGCAAFYLRQLERQRDLALTWPLGIGLAVPGFVLMILGLTDGDQSPVGIALIAVFAFVCLAAMAYGRHRAAEWQREIEQLREAGRQ